MFYDHFISVNIQEGIMLVRDASGSLSTNIPHLITHHSPTGFEWGYSGSGPSDLALNIVERVLRVEGYQGLPFSPQRDGQFCFYVTWQMHQSFKAAFIAPIVEQAGVVKLDYATVRDWIFKEVERLLGRPVE